MKIQTLDIETMLHAAFLKAELDFLKSNPRFSEALPLVKTMFQFQRLCARAEELLAAGDHANASAKQFRESCFTRERLPALAESAPLVCISRFPEEIFAGGRR